MQCTLYRELSVKYVSTYRSRRNTTPPATRRPCSSLGDMASSRPTPSLDEFNVIESFLSTLVMGLVSKVERIHVLEFVWNSANSRDWPSYFELRMNGSMHRCKGQGLMHAMQPMRLVGGDIPSPSFTC